MALRAGIDVFRELPDNASRRVIPHPHVRRNSARAARRHVDHTNAYGVCLRSLIASLRDWLRGWCKLDCSTGRVQSLVDCSPLPAFLARLRGRSAALDPRRQFINVRLRYLPIASEFDCVREAPRLLFTIIQPHADTSLTHLQTFGGFSGR